MHIFSLITFFSIALFYCLVNIWGLLCKQDNFVSWYLLCMPFIFFSCLYTLVGLSSPMSNGSDERDFALLQAEGQALDLSTLSTVSQEGSFIAPRECNSPLFLIS